MGCFASPQRDPRGAAKSSSTVVLVEESSMINQMFSDEWHVIKGLHMKVLVIRENKDYVWSTSPRPKYWLLIIGSKYSAP
jgi:hypothetical protein